MNLDLEKILKELEPYREKRVRVHPKHAALLAIDLQNYFHRILQPILKNLLNVIQSCRQKDIPTIFTQYGHTNHHLATLKNFGFGFATLLTCDELIRKLGPK